MTSDKVFKSAIKARQSRKLCLGSIKKYGVSFNEVEILNLIANQKNLTPAKISNSLCMEPAIISRKLKILNSGKLINCKQCDDDLRVTNVEITKKGKKLLALLLDDINSISINQ